MGWLVKQVIISVPIIHGPEVLTVVMTDGTEERPVSMSLADFKDWERFWQEVRLQAKIDFEFYRITPGSIDDLHQNWEKMAAALLQGAIRRN